jgi:hypothetical protein
MVLRALKRSYKADGWFGVATRPLLTHNGVRLGRAQVHQDYVLILWAGDMAASYRKR